MVTRVGWCVFALCAVVVLPALAYRSQQVVCREVCATMVIDGKLSEWDRSSPLVLDDSSQLVRDHGIWKGPLDCSARIFLMWDQTNLYVAAEILDDVPFIERQGMGIDLFDSIELYMTTDPLADADRALYASADFRILLSMIADAWPWETYVDRYPVAEKAGLESGPLAEYERAWSGSLGGYTFEARIPFANFHTEGIPLLTPVPGMVVGFDAAVNDVDVWCPLQPCPSMTWGGDETIKESPGRWGTLRFESHDEAAACE